MARSPSATDSVCCDLRELRLHRSRCTLYGDSPAGSSRGSSPEPSPRTRRPYVVPRTRSILHAGLHLGPVAAPREGRDHSLLPELTLSSPIVDPIPDDVKRKRRTCTLL